MSSDSLTVRKIVGSVASLNELSQKDLPSALAFSLATTLQTLQTEVVDVYNKQQREILEEMSETITNAEGKEIRGVPRSKAVELQGRLDELLDKEVTVVFDKVPIAAFQGVSIKPATLVALRYLVVSA